MRSGDLRSRIRIERRATAQDPEFGSSTDSWVLVAEVWAEVDDQLQPKAVAMAKELRLSFDQVLIRIRYREGIETGMRVTELNGLKRVFQITSGPAMTKWREEMQMMAEAFSS